MPVKGREQTVLQPQNLQTTSAHASVMSSQRAFKYHGKPRMRVSKRTFGASPRLCSYFLDDCYFGITSRASLLATNSRISVLFFPASIIASRDP
jgi:hypothetical protein